MPRYDCGSFFQALGDLNGRASDSPVHSISPSWEFCRETDLQPEPPQACSHARIPCALCYPKRPQGTPSPSRKRSRPTSILSGSTPSSPGSAPSSERLTRQRRLLREVQFRRVFADPYKSSDRYFSLLARVRCAAEEVIAATPQAPGASWHSARLGLAISRKCAAKAVDRNRIKRLVRDSFRRHRWPDCPLDIVVMCRPPARDADRRLLHSSLQRHWTKLRELACVGSPI